MIKLNPELMQLTREGKKKATSRLGIKEYTLGSNTLVNAENPEDKIEIIVTGLELVTKRHMACSQRVARLENYDEPQDLVDKLEQIYGKLEDEDEFTVVHFKTVM